MQHLRLMMVALMSLSVINVCSAEADSASGWKRHTIDNSSRGADGVRIADIDGDGLPDFVTGWEEGGVIRAYRNPGTKHVKQAWPAVTVGKVKSPEDAVFADLDGDGAMDIVSSCEGRNRTAFVHWAPKNSEQYFEAQAWVTEPIPATSGKQSWMFCLPQDVDGRNGTDLILGSKGGNAEVGWLQSPEDPRNVSAWKWHTIYKAGWIMSLIPADMDGDGDEDVLITDRKGKSRGCHWLENPGQQNDITTAWAVHTIGGTDREVMFADYADLDGDGKNEVLMATRGGEVLLFRKTADNPNKWAQTEIPMPPNVGTGKSARIADIDLNGTMDLVVSCENSAKASGLFWLSAEGTTADANWLYHEISGQTEGIKFDLIQMLDLDGDGDLDVVTCEERDNLGVIWYENPAR